MAASKRTYRKQVSGIDADFIEPETQSFYVREEFLVDIRDKRYNRRFQEKVSTLEGVINAIRGIGVESLKHSTVVISFEKIAQFPVSE